jgi:hypothetical protein
VDTISLPDAAHVLEVGCGAGHTAVALAQRGYRVHALDATPEMIALTRRAAESAGLPLTTRLAAGMWAKTVAGFTINRRAEPDLQSARTGQIPNGDIVRVADGPRCADGYVWWQLNYDSMMGWTAEGDVKDGSYWLQSVGKIATPAADSSEPDGCLQLPEVYDSIQLGFVTLNLRTLAMLDHMWQQEGYFAREPYHTWRKKNFVRVLLQTGQKKDPQLPDVPLLSELMDEAKTSDLGRRVTTVMLGSGEMGRPVVAHPGTSPDVTKLLREAFMKSMADPQLLADATRGKIEITPVSGEELTKVARDVINQPKEVLDRIRKILAQ